MREVYSGQRSPNSEEIGAFTGCYAGGSDAVPNPLQMEFPDFETLPEISAPMEINTVAWPMSFQAATLLLERLPDNISGHIFNGQDGRLSDFRVDFGFGEISETQEPALVAKVMDLDSGEFFPVPTTAGGVIAFVAQGFGGEVLAAGREGSLAWTHLKTESITEGVSRDIYALLFGHATGPLVFSAEAGSPTELMALVQAMVSVAR